MKVKFIVGKYKPAEGDEWLKFGDIADLPNEEAIAAIAGGAAKAIGESSPPQPPAMPEPTPTDSRRGKVTAKSEE